MLKLWNHILYLSRLAIKDTVEEKDLYTCWNILPIDLREGQICFPSIPELTTYSFLSTVFSQLPIFNCSSGSVQENNVS